MLRDLFYSKQSSFSRIEYFFNTTIAVIYLMSSKDRRNAQFYEVLQISQIENEFITFFIARFLSVLIKFLSISPKNIT